MPEQRTLLTGRQVESDDIALLAMSGLREEYLVMRLKDGSTTLDTAPQHRSLRRYLYDKYVYRSGDQPRDAVHADGAANGTVNEAVFATEAGVRLQVRPPVS